MGRVGNQVRKASSERRRECHRCAWGSYEPHCMGLTVKIDRDIANAVDIFVDNHAETTVLRARVG